MIFDFPRLFADITANLEDLHAVSVEGQRNDNSPDVQLILAGQLHHGLSRVSAITQRIVQGLAGND